MKYMHGRLLIWLQVAIPSIKSLLSMYEFTSMDYLFHYGPSKEYATMSVKIVTFLPFIHTIKNTIST
ncbi:hypothetical protein SADUNF_Sadunf16G0079900 [Salix dunnii]|uniref:Uncharacterized protein n=1 Tax=Salix dunnii TaxID=1413687 RepID=A0A835MFZ0_9ROSI|nr:hypothetical protein SADUNF_Sadunf16G0079900 [Salix dunnii]